MKSPEPDRVTCTDEAKRLVFGDRNEAYGTPRDDFYGCGLMFTALCRDILIPGAVISPERVALMLAGMKLNRHAHKPKRDNIVDAHGYLLCLEWIENDAKPDSEKQS